MKVTGASLATAVVTGASLATAVVAGCLGDDDDETAADTGDDGTDTDAGSNGIEIEAGTEIVFDGYTHHWAGLEPDAIAGDENPTLILEEGGEYTMEWINADGVTHDLQIWDESDDVVDDLATDSINEEGDSDSLEFTAESEMVTYVCSYHVGTQVGDLVVE
ncbi:PKD domain-containing protein [Natronolimnobius sp. AArcel1]|nr:PKD domain-containing protein [Natronolimnobius sp. AArcel1]